MAQFSLKSLLGAVAVTGIGLAGLTHPTREFNFILVSLAIAVVGLFTLHAVCSRSPSRPFSIGFSIAGCIYFLLLACHVEYSLLTTWALEVLYPLLNRQPDTNMTHFGIFHVMDNGFPLLTKYSNYLHIGHALWMLAIAYVGGLVATAFSAGQRDKK
jgi:hypothetical protein